MADCDTLKASNDLRLLKAWNLINSKGKGKATYYVAGEGLSSPPAGLSTQTPGLSTQAGTLSTHGDTLSTHGNALSTHGNSISTYGEADLKEDLIEELPVFLREKILSIKEREKNSANLVGIIKEICCLRAYKSAEIAVLLNKREDYIRRKFLLPLIKNKEIKYLYPEMIKHPDQAYCTIQKS